MPFVSEKQERWMWANEPEMARRWADEAKAAVERNTTRRRKRKKRKRSRRSDD